jgi:hypothetical protein
MERPHGSALAGATARAVDPEFLDPLVLLTTIAAAGDFAIERGQQLLAGRGRVRPSGKPLRSMDLSSDGAPKVGRTRTQRVTQQARPLKGKEKERRDEKARLKRLRAQRPCDRCALFQLCRKVFEASRLNLWVRVNPALFLGKRNLKVSLWKAVHGCAKVQN